MGTRWVSKKLCSHHRCGFLAPSDRLLHLLRLCDFCLQSKSILQTGVIASAFWLTDQIPDCSHDGCLFYRGRDRGHGRGPCPCPCPYHGHSHDPYLCHDPHDPCCCSQVQMFLSPQYYLLLSSCRRPS